MSIFQTMYATDSPVRRVVARTRITLRVASTGLALGATAELRAHARCGRSHSDVAQADGDVPPARVLHDVVAFDVHVHRPLLRHARDRHLLSGANHELLVSQPNVRG